MIIVALNNVCDLATTTTIGRYLMQINVNAFYEILRSNGVHMFTIPSFGCTINIVIASILIINDTSCTMA